MRKNKILLLSGDGIGPEISEQALKVLNIIETKKNIQFEIIEGLMGGIAIDQTNSPLPQETLDKLNDVDAVLLAAIGGPKWENLPQHQKPEKGLLQLRKHLDAFANLRPAKVFPCLAQHSSLKPEIISGIDILIVRELTSGIYFGEPRAREYNTMRYTEDEIARVIRVAADSAMKRNKQLCSVDKANVLEVSQMWRDIATNIISKEYPEINLTHMYVDNCAMQLIHNPKQFDVIVTSNLFGDILSDEASMLTGSIGLLPSASLGNNNKPGIFEPVHGSAPDIAGQGIANPIAMILSLSMMLKYAFDLPEIANNIEQAVENTLEAGNLTKDLGGTLGTQDIGQKICDNLSELL